MDTQTEPQKKEQTKRRKMFNNDLTVIQKEKLDYIVNYILNEHCPPTQREIAKYFNHTSQTSGQHILQSLKRKGYISTREKGKNRNYKLTLKAINLYGKLILNPRSTN